MANWFDTFAPADSSGTLPNENAAASFRYKRALIWHLTLGLGTGSIDGVYKGSHTIEILTQDESEVYFRSKVTTVLLFATFANIIYTWNFLRDEIETTIIDGKAVTPETIGPYLLGGTAASEQGDMQPASGEGAFLGEGAIIADWLSPIYTFEKGGAKALPPGYKIRISKETWKLGARDNAYSFAFDDAPPKPYFLFDRVEALRGLIPQGDQLRVRHTYAGPEQNRIRDTLSGVTQASQWQDETGRFYVLARKDDRFLVWYSDLDGMELKPLLYDAAHDPSGDLEGQQVEYFKGNNWKNVSPPVATTSGEVLICAQLGSELFFQRAQNVYVPGPLVKVGNHAGRPCSVVPSDRAGNKIVLVDDRTFQAQTLDGGTNWEIIE